MNPPSLVALNLSDAKNGLLGVMETIIHGQSVHLICALVQVSKNGARVAVVPVASDNSVIWIPAEEFRVQK